MGNLLIEIDLLKFQFYFQPSILGSNSFPALWFPSKIAFIVYSSLLLSGRYCMLHASAKASVCPQDLRLYLLSGMDSISSIA